LTNLCAVLQAYDHRTALKAAGKFDIETNSALGNCQIQISMSVNVRQLCQNSQDIMGPFPTVVRLQTLDECKRHFGNTRKRFSETLVGKWGTVMSAFNHAGGNRQPQRKSAFLVPISGQGSGTRVELDEVESQVIESGAKLVNDFADKDGDVHWGFGQNVEILVTVRIGNDFIRTCSNGEIVKSIEVKRCLFDFSRSRIYAADHAGDNNKPWLANHIIAQVKARRSRARSRENALTQPPNKLTDGRYWEVTKKIAKFSGNAPTTHYSLIGAG
jgi:hypothetical protein